MDQRAAFKSFAADSSTSWPEPELELPVPRAAAEPSRSRGWLTWRTRIVRHSRWLAVGNKCSSLRSSFVGRRSSLAAAHRSLLAVDCHIRSCCFGSNYGGCGGSDSDVPGHQWCRAPKRTRRQAQPRTRFFETLQKLLLCNTNIRPEWVENPERQRPPGITTQLMVRDR